MRQLEFEFTKNYKKEFGGSLLFGKRKSKRPLATNSPIHLILRAECSKAFPPGHHKLEAAMKELAHTYGIKVFRKSFNWNHFHAIIQIPSRHAYNSFIRRWTSEIIRLRNQPSVFRVRPYKGGLGLNSKPVWISTNQASNTGKNRAWIIREPIMID